MYNLLFKNMGYGDYTPSGGHHSKKPLTKAQIRKIQENYKKADEITQKIQEAEKLEKEKNINILTNLF